MFLEGNEKIRRFIAKNEEKINDFEDISENNKKKEGYKMFSLKTLAIGGTFDYLHNGHKVNFKNKQYCNKIIFCI